MRRRLVRRLFLGLRGRGRGDEGGVRRDLDDELDGDLAKGLRQLLAFDGDVENTFCRTFEDDDPAGLQAVWKFTSELGYFHAVEHVGRPKFDFHTGYGARRSS